MTGNNFLDHLLTLACIDMRVIEYSSFLEHSSLFDAKERRVFSCTTAIVWSGCVHVFCGASPAKTVLLSLTAAMGSCVLQTPHKTVQNVAYCLRPDLRLFCQDP